MVRTILALMLLTASQVGGWRIMAQSGTGDMDRKTGQTMHATGTFVVKISPADTPDLAKEAGLGCMTIDKAFSGDLEATSKGEMLTGGTESTGAMAYVAIERVTGKLNGRSGSFLLMHNASMLKSDPQSGTMQVAVVPHSASGELAGLTGNLKIVIEGGKHNYDLAYQLP